MLNDRYVRTHPDDVLAAIRRRHAGADAERALGHWLALDAERRAAATRRDDLARAVTHARAEGGAPAALTGERELRAAEDTLAELEAQARGLLLHLPNLPDPRVPDETTELRRWGEPPTFTFTPRPHDEIAAELGILDLPRAARLAGSRFPLLIGAGARLARAL